MLIEFTRHDLNSIDWAVKSLLIQWNQGPLDEGPYLILDRILKNTVLTAIICKTSIIKHIRYESLHDKTNKMTCAPSEDSDQSGPPPSLIRIFSVRMTTPWVLSYSLNAQRRLWSHRADAQAYLESSLSCINVRQVPSEVLNTQIEGSGFHHLPRDRANDNALKNHVWSLLWFIA